MTTTPATTAPAAMSAPTVAPVVLIERDATRVGGHWYRAAVDLAHAAVRDGRLCQVVALGGIDPRARSEFIGAGARVLTVPGPFAAQVLHRLALICPAFSGPC